jgi:hypothetical protein
MMINMLYIQIVWFFPATFIEHNLQNIVHDISEDPIERVIAATLSSISNFGNIPRRLT